MTSLNSFSGKTEKEPCRREGKQAVCEHKVRILAGVDGVGNPGRPGEAESLEGCASEHTGFLQVEEETGGPSSWARWWEEAMQGVLEEMKDEPGNTML